MEYQHDYSRNPAVRGTLYDREARRRKADKVLAVLRDRLGPLEELELLDLSCSTGIMTARFAGACRRAVGIDIDEEAVAHARANRGDEPVEYHVMDALHSSFPDASFDVVVCNHMYEHVPDPERLMSEIDRLLKPDGACYFGAASRWVVLEPHHGNLPFLSWLPKPLAHRYLRLTGRGTHYYENLRTHAGLRRLCRAFRILDYTVPIVREPERFAAGDVLPPGSRRRRWAARLVRAAYRVLPGYVWLLVRPGSRHA